MTNRYPGYIIGDKSDAGLGYLIVSWNGKCRVERVQTEKSQPLLLDESYQRLFELLPIGVTVLDMKGLILYCNPAVYSKGGYTEDEFTGKHFSKIASV